MTPQFFRPLVCAGLLAFGPLAAAQESAAVDMDIPAQIPLFTRASLYSTKGKADGADCAAAMAVAAEKAKSTGKSKGTAIPIAAYPEKRLDPKPLDKVDCKLSGDPPDGASVDFYVLAIRPGLGFPSVPPARAADILSELMRIHETDLEDIEIKELFDKLYFKASSQKLDEELDARVLDQNGRAVRALEDVVAPWVAGWAGKDKQVPEMAGAIMDIEVTSVVDKKKTKEVFRYSVPVKAGADFTFGRITDQEFAEKVFIYHVVNEKKGKLSRLNLDTTATGSDTRTGARGTLDESDLDGLEDEEL